MKVREEMGITNVKLMIPFCRTVEKGKKVLAVMADVGLRRGEQGLKVYVMCEIPANVILTEEFAEIFDTKILSAALQRKGPIKKGDVMKKYTLSGVIIGGCTA